MSKVAAAIVIGIIGLVALIYFTMDFPFSLEREDFTEEYEIQEKWDLPQRLEEISGMDFVDDERMAAIQDEEGIIFIYNLTSKKIEQEIEFGKDGDYEGLALFGKDAFVLRSDGILFEVQDYLTKDIKVTEHETFIKAKHNAEGLCADLKNNRLLITVKDRDPLSNNTKGIYAFDLETKKLLQTPAYAIDLEDPIFSDVKRKNKLMVMMPSEVNINPVTGEIYITDGRNPKLLILSPDGDSKKLYLLKREKFYQPEGIAFKKNGELFISNEGHSDPANILRIKLQ
ncbi:SdiA-regulated domain-containing protein [Zunongwangia endophytica]|uniref:SdiA-regulated domain-containing protein n=1 Tax=Zunongwangia endophytica TaxID=1808945 RepID=A0ABV8HH94_9FLAO|nr:SdiA-regulated domain-containing protein [Zunongwangia endophytica]MDN3594131.1 SdiA-regulated domain-containing protein [Zunongwangia endophytica]